jgi:hypothetical protein
MHYPSPGQYKYFDDRYFARKEYIRLFGPKNLTKNSFVEFPLVYAGLGVARMS